MVFGSLALSIMAFVEVGGLGGLMYKYFEAVPEGYKSSNGTGNLIFGNSSYSPCGLPRADAFHLIRDPVNSDLPWPGVLLRSTIISVLYWCGDQIIVQRVLAAKNIAHARGGTVFAGFLKFLPLFLIIMPGMISRVLYPESLVCQNAEMCMRVCNNPAGCSNLAYPKLILSLAPTGMRGVMMAVMIAALMSSLTSVFNSSAVIFTLDIWKTFRQSASERELLIIGKIFVVILVAVSIAWIPLMETAQEGQLFMYIQAINGYLVPPFCAVFLLAVFVPRVNETITHNTK
ncbi:sodium/myo-inositol cotransporter 2-like [Mizuhopecten yessoensis]|uniref:sodium/myo-inositol cotransporter 2-like n=1 Tax=Mizuhopecten yessoensis TaxID=6573 RepID=UPI000B4576D9|nr:sodium/myo-inositol cotransporter 2-like [Mizuhopecten yessoensis]